jgi:hypothetical protein
MMMTTRIDLAAAIKIRVRANLVGNVSDPELSGSLEE